MQRTETSMFAWHPLSTFMILGCLSQHVQNCQKSRGLSPTRVVSPTKQGALLQETRQCAVREAGSPGCKTLTQNPLCSTCIPAMRSSNASSPLQM